MMNEKRREFLKKTGFAVGGIMMFPACTHLPAPFRFFTQEEADCLIAICECIIPADDTPGATDAGVIYYIDRQITGIFKKNQSDYREGLKAVQADCRDLFNSKFENLPVKKQLDYLEMLEENNDLLNSWERILPPQFFNMVIAHTLQGFYGAPRHGGNKNYMSYRILGIEYPFVIGQNRYKKKM